MTTHGVLAVILLCVFIGAAICVAIVRRVATGLGLVAKPRTDRWHSKPTALYGGVGMILPFVLGAIAVYNVIARRTPEIHADRALFTLWCGYLAAAVLHFAIGLLDDIYVMRPVTKLGCQICAACVFILSGGLWNLTDSSVVNYCFTFLWLIGIVNAVNLLDNMDGISSGVIMIGALGISLIGLAGEQSVGPVSVWIGLCLLCSVLGFWVFNLPPATIFMGDSGSLFIGFAFAALTIPSALNQNYGISVGDGLAGLSKSFIAITLAAIPILDTSLVTVTRLWRGQSPAVGGRDHSTHRLARSGLTAKQTILVIYTMSAICVVFALLMQRAPHLAFVMFGVLTGGFLLTAFYLSNIYVEFKERKVFPWHSTIRRVVYKTSVFKILCDIPVAILAFYLAYLLRFDFEIPAETSEAVWQGMIFALICMVIANIFSRAYRISWRSPGGSELVQCAAYALITTILTLAAIALSTRFDGGHSRGGIAVFGILFFFGLLSVRFSFRFFDEVVFKLKLWQPRAANAEERRVLIFGTDRRARILYSLVSDSAEFKEYEVVGFVEERMAKAGDVFSGLPIYSLSELAAKGGDVSADEVWCISRIDDEEARRLLQQVASSRIAVRSVHVSVGEMHMEN